MIQIAGVLDYREAAMILDCGATHVGLPLRLPDGREDVDETTARAIVAALPRQCTVLITYQTVAREIVAFADFLGVQAVQLHGSISREQMEKLRSTRPQWFLLKTLVVHPDRTDNVVIQSREFAPLVDAFLTDTFDPATGRRGATGRTHDWRISRALVEASGVPVVLAGGLTPDNVGEAIRAVQPWGIDAHTGVEDDRGRKDRTKVKRFVEEFSRWRAASG